MAALSALNRILALIAAALFVAAGVMLTYEVAARYFFIRPTIWAAELSQLCLIWGTLIAMAWALETRRHIAVDALVRHFPEGVRLITDALSMIVVAAFSAVTAWKGWEIFWDSWERGRTSGTLLDLPAWVPELAVPLGFGLLFVQAVVEVGKVIGGGTYDAKTELE